MEKSNKPLNKDIIKYIAMLTMLLNHISLVFLDPMSTLAIIFTDIGYFTAITMCYFLVEGYKYTSSKKKYALRLLLIAIPTQIPYVLAFGDYLFGYFPLNMLFTLFLSFLILVAKEKINNAFLQNLTILILIMLASICDWSIMAPIFVLLFNWAKDDNNKKLISFGASAILFIVMSYPNESYFAFFNAISMLIAGFCLVFLYNGKRMTKYKNFSKWFFYLFYPLHLLILYLINQYII